MQNKRIIPQTPIHQVLDLIGDPTAGQLAQDHDVILAAIGGLAVNTRVKISLPVRLEIPEADQTDFKIWLLLYDETGHMEDADAVPIVAVENETGVSRSGNLRNTTVPATTMIRTGVGTYWIYYRVEAAAAHEFLTFTFSVTEATLDRTFKAETQVTDESDVETLSLAIKAKTDNLPSDPADQSAVEAAIAAAHLISDNKIDALQADLGDPSARANLKTLLALLGNPDGSNTKTIYGNIGDFAGQVNLTSLLASLGIPDVAGNTLYAMQGAFTATENLKSILGDLSTTKRLGQVLGSLTEIDNLQAILGAYTAAAPLKAAIDAIQTDIGDPSTRTNLKTLLALLGNPDAANKSIYGNMGDFVGQTNLQSLLAALGIPDTAGKPLYTCLVTDRLDNGTYGLSALQTLLVAIAGYIDTEVTAIKNKTDNLPSDPADQSAVEAAVTVTNGKVDNLDADLVLAKAAIDAIQTDLGDPSARTNLKTIVALLGLPDAASSSVYDLLGAFTNVQNLKAILGGYTAAAPIKAAIDTLVPRAALTGTVSISNTSETTLLEWVTATYGQTLIKSFKVDMTSFNTNGAAASYVTLRVYEKIDASTYRLRSDDSVQFQYVKGTTTPIVIEIANISASHDVKITAQISATPGGACAMVYRAEYSSTLP